MRDLLTSLFTDPFTLMCALASYESCIPLGQTLRTRLIQLKTLNKLLQNRIQSHTICSHLNFVTIVTRLHVQLQLVLVTGTYTYSIRCKTCSCSCMHCIAISALYIAFLQWNCPHNSWPQSRESGRRPTIVSLENRHINLIAKLHSKVYQHILYL